MNLFVGAALLCLVAWAVLLYVLAIPSGWVHVPLAVGCVLMARGLMGKPRR